MWKEGGQEVRKEAVDIGLDVDLGPHSPILRDHPDLHLPPRSGYILTLAVFLFCRGIGIARSRRGVAIYMTPIAPSIVHHLPLSRDPSLHSNRSLIGGDELLEVAVRSYLGKGVSEVIVAVDPADLIELPTLVGLA